MYQKNRLKIMLLGLVLLLGMFFISSTVVQAQYWQALPPYNTLWPLWSPPLSPINPLSGLPTPIVSNLRPSTVLPVQPGLTWDPNMEYPWLLYAPIDLALINGWSGLSPTSTEWILGTLPVANNAFINSYPAYAVAYETLLGGSLANLPIFATLVNPAPPLQSLLTPAYMLGLGTLIP